MSVFNAIRNGKRAAFIKTLMHNKYNQEYENELIAFLQNAPDFSVALAQMRVYVSDSIGFKNIAELAAQEATKRSFLIIMRKAKARLLANEAALCVATKTSRKFWNSVRNETKRCFRMNAKCL